MSWPILLRILLFLGILLLVELYVFSAVKTVFTAPRARQVATWVYWGLTAVFLLLVLNVFFAAPRADGPSSPSVRILIGALFIIYVPKLVILFFLASEDIYRLVRAGYVVLKDQFSGSAPGETPLYFQSRREFISRLALLAASIPALGIIYGIARGRYNYKIHRITLAFKDLPDTFHGTRIAQLSDLHIGSFNLWDKEKLQYAVELVNSENPDLLFFTGDMVNNRSEEMEPWTEVFTGLKAGIGKFSVFGNHDYGDYVQWGSKEEKIMNLETLAGMHRQMGFKLLRNENVRIEKGGQFIELLGMENWGKGFAKYGDYERTLTGTSDDAFRILLSHDPTHWEEQVISHSKHVHLTLSGHTHGAQFGIEVPGIKISPVQLRYRRWAGLYTENDRHLYINRGIGFIGFPGRVGIWPEITVITLEKA